MSEPDWLDPETVRGDIDSGVWYRAAFSGLWYRCRHAAGYVTSVMVDGVLFARTRPEDSPE